MGKLVHTRLNTNIYHHIVAGNCIILLYQHDLHSSYHMIWSFWCTEYTSLRLFLENKRFYILDFNIFSSLTCYQWMYFNVVFNKIIFLRNIFYQMIHVVVFLHSDGMTHSYVIYFIFFYYNDKCVFPFINVSNTLMRNIARMSCQLNRIYINDKDCVLSW